MLHRRFAKRNISFVVSVEDGEHVKRTETPTSLEHRDRTSKMFSVVRRSSAQKIVPQLAGGFLTFQNVRSSPCASVVSVLVPRFCTLISWSYRM